MSKIDNSFINLMIKTENQAYVPNCLEVICTCAKGSFLSASSHAHSVTLWRSFLRQFCITHESARCVGKVAPGGIFGLGKSPNFEYIFVDSSVSFYYANLTQLFEQHSMTMFFESWICSAKFQIYVSPYSFRFDSFKMWKYLIIG